LHSYIPGSKNRRPHEKGFDKRNHRAGRLYLSELLISKGYEVHGLIRRASTFNTAG
jgi:hypothetical protein